MRPTRLLSAVAVSLAAAVITAGPSAAVTDPDIRSFPGGPTCSGDVFSGMVRVSSTTGNEFPGTVELRYNAGGKAFASSTISTPFTVRSKGTRDYSFSFNIAQLPANTVNLVAYAVVGPPATPIDTQLSKVIPIATCAPAEVIPEAPVAALIPLTLAGTAGIVLVVVRRRAARDAA